LPNLKKGETEPTVFDPKKQVSKVRDTPTTQAIQDGRW
jgi:hypothetical protein